MKLPTVSFKPISRTQPCASLVALVSVSYFALAELPALAQIELSSESIASSAMNVAEQTRSTGRCYAAVCRALHPLGVELSGAAAYQAQPLLLKDPRFVPLTVNSVDELRRGDIVVYTRSSSHPYGHISVYQGNYEEASDHVAPITHTKAYGAATVFRLRRGDFDEPASIAAAPIYQSRDHSTSYRNANYIAANQSVPQAQYGSNYPYGAQAQYLPPEAYQNRNIEYRTTGGADQSSSALLRSVRNGCGKISRSPMGRTLLKKAANFLFGD